VEPVTYACDDDGEDLTELVEDAAEQWTPVTFGGGKRIVVSCPGKGTPHYVVFDLPDD
jgi:hypothetical protein